MSFHNSDRKIQSKKGKSFPGNAEHNGGLFAQTIAMALREEFGGACTQGGEGFWVDGGVEACVFYGCAD